MKITRQEWIAFILGLIMGSLVGLFIGSGNMPINKAEAKSMPPIVIPTMKPIPTIVPISYIDCHTFILDQCFDATFVGKTCPKKWFEGKCEAPEPTPEPTEEPEPTIIPEPTTEPVITPEPVEGVSTPTCSDLMPIKVSDIWVENPVANDGKLTIRWGTNPSYGEVHIRYSEIDGEWRYALLGTDNDGTEEIGALQNGVHYWFQVAYVNGCAVGEYSHSFDPLP